MDKILVIGPSWVGDMMMSHSLYRTLKALQPDCQIDVMAPAWCNALLTRMPEVNRLITMPIGHGELALTKRWQLAKQLASEGYQHAIVTPNSLKSALIPFFANIPKRTGWKGEMRYGLLNDLRTLNKSLFPRMVERYIALAYPKAQVYSAEALPKPLLLPQLHSTKAQQTAVFTLLKLSTAEKYIVFCPGAAFGPAKCWPAYHYATLARNLIELGYHVLLLGAANEHFVTEKIVAALTDEQRQHCTDLAGKTTLEQTIDIIAASAAVVSNDSGLMHIAAALAKPLVALYGPTSPDFTPPLSSQAKVLRLMDGYVKIRQSNTDSGYHQSLIDLKPDYVFSELMSLLEKKLPE